MMQVKHASVLKEVSVLLHLIWKCQNLKDMGLIS